MSAIINIHIYNRFAHQVKLNVLEYLHHFKDEILTRSHDGKIKKDGKELWLTENACIYTDGDLQDKTSEQVQAEFVQQVLWLDTQLTPEQQNNAACTDWSAVNAPTTLPGLATTDRFEWGGETLSWYERGFGGYTWFSAAHFPGFPTSCSTQFAAYLNSSIFSSSGEPNAVFNALMGSQ